MPKKSLGQHWLRDAQSLQKIIDAASLDSDDIVLEIGPGNGDLTRKLVEVADKVVAVEIDSSLADTLATIASSGSATNEIRLVTPGL